MTTYPLPLAAVEAASAALLGSAREVISITPTTEDFPYRSGEAGEHVVVLRDGDGERRAVLRRLGGRVSVMREEGVHLVAGERVVNARPELGVAWIARPGGVVSLTLVPEVPSYLDSLHALMAEGVASDGDAIRARDVAKALVRHHTPALERTDAAYVRGLRALLEGPRGAHASLDAMPAHTRGPLNAARLATLERKFVAWRWRFRPRADRLRITHGDASPWSIALAESHPEFLYTQGPMLGDAASDVAELAAWIFAAAVREPVAWEDGLMPVWDAFWTTYLGDSGDHELLDVVPPFLAAHVLAYASPARDPGLSLDKRDRLVAFAEAVLDAGSFDPDQAKTLVR